MDGCNQAALLGSDQQYAWLLNGVVWRFLIAFLLLALTGCLSAGESAAVARGPGATVHAGTVNVGGTTLLIRTTAAAGDTAVARMAALVEKVRGRHDIAGCGIPAGASL